MKIITPSAFYPLPSTLCLLPSAFYPLPSTLCLLPSALFSSQVGEIKPKDGDEFVVSALALM
jgi:hypothetical protein